MAGVIGEGVAGATVEGAVGDTTRNTAGDAEGEVSQATRKTPLTKIIQNQFRMRNITSNEALSDK